MKRIRARINVTRLRVPVRALVSTASRHPVTRNAAALYAIQAANYVFPLILVAYLARVLRPSGYGMVLLAQSVALWLALLMEYGFGLSATREVAKHRSDREQLRAIVGGVLGAEAVLAFAAAGLAAAIALLGDAFRASPRFALLAWLVAVGQALAPVWYFQGMEQMTYPAALNVVTRALVTVATLVWVTRPEDDWKVLALQGTAGLVVASVMVARVARDIRPSWPDFRTIRTALRAGWSMFFFRSSVSLYTTANTLILGLFVPPERVAFYGGPEKVSKAILAGLGPISQAVYPRMSRLVAEDPNKAARDGRVALVLMGTLGMGLGFLTWAWAPIIVSTVLGPGYEPAVPVLRVLAWLTPTIALSNAMGIQWMLPCRMDRLFNTIIACSGLLNIGLALILAPRMGPVGMAMAVLVTELTVTLSMFAVLWRHHSSLLRPVNHAG